MRLLHHAWRKYLLLARARPSQPLPSFLPRGGVSRGGGSGRGGGLAGEAGLGLELEPGARSVAPEMPICPPPPPLSCLAFPGVSRKAVTGGFFRRLNGFAPVS